MSIGDPSRENEPSAFGWIFAGVLGAAAVGAAAWAVVTGRRRGDDVEVGEVGDVIAADSPPTPPSTSD